jgi:uncharacterized protein (TIGR03435 family)
MRALLQALLLVMGTSASAQTFDAASIRLNPQPVFERGFVGVQPGRLIAMEASLRDLAAEAYGVRHDQVVGATGWMLSERYDITATLPAATRAAGTPADEVRAMLRALLTERFALRLRRETRTLPAYTLRLARAGGQFGPQLRRSGPQCAPPVPPPGVPGPPPPPPPDAGVRTTPLGGSSRSRCPTMFFTGTVSSRAAPIASLAQRLTQVLARPVIDATGLSGEFDIDLYYQTGVSAGGDTGLDGSAPSLMAAVQDQLGLRLESGRAPVEVLVIEGARRPAEQ